MPAAVSVIRFASIVLPLPATPMPAQVHALTSRSRRRTKLPAIATHVLLSRITGLAPTPYAPIIAGAVPDPPPAGFSEPLQLEPLASRIDVPGARTTPLTLASVFHAVCGLVPLLVSLPATEFT